MLKCFASLTNYHPKLHFHHYKQFYWSFFFLSMTCCNVLFTTLWWAIWVALLNYLCWGQPKDRLLIHKWTWVCKKKLTKINSFLKQLLLPRLLTSSLSTHNLLFFPHAKHHTAIFKIMIQVPKSQFPWTNFSQLFHCFHTSTFFSNNKHHWRWF